MLWLCSARIGEANTPRLVAAASDRRTRKNPAGVTQRGLCSGDVLLSHNLEMHYHRGCSVSLPCSEWERVGPLRYDHQTP